jgi:pSer/pThr/pTyr-binding forkhead associated (FHA) protein
VAGNTCPDCGHENTPGANFCSSCGNALGDQDEPTTITFQIDTSDPDDATLTLDLDDIPSEGLLVVTHGTNAGSQFALTDDVTTAGRHPESTIFLDDITVSRRHAELRRDDEGYVVRDAGSLNGTYVNRKRIDDDHRLRDRDELQVGMFRLVFVAGPRPDAG